MYAEPEKKRPFWKAALGYVFAAAAALFIIQWLVTRFLLGSLFGSQMLASAFEWAVGMNVSPDFYVLYGGICAAIAFFLLRRKR